MSIEKIITNEEDNFNNDFKIKENGFSTSPYMSEDRKALRKRARELGYDDEYHMEGHLYFQRYNNPNWEGHAVDVFNNNNNNIED